MSQSSSAEAFGLKAEADGSQARNATPDSTRDIRTPSTVAQGKLKRKTRRLVWTEDLHLRFVSAVFELGVKKASPKDLLALMEAKDPTEGLTSEHIKSHLQKYRINYQRSRLEVQKLNEKHATRSFKRHHRHTQRRADETNSDDGVSFVEAAPMDAILPPDTTEHMHWTMQQRMDFHRELLLTRSVEEASGLSWASRMSSIGADSNVNELQEVENASFLQAWANAEQLRQQEEQVYGRLHQQQQNLFPQQHEAVLISMGGSQPETRLREPDESMDPDGGVDLTSWSRLSLTVDPDDDDVFGFLNPTA